MSQDKSKSVSEHHQSHRINWLRAAVLGANDGIISTSSLIVGIAAANSTQHNILIAGIAGLVAGAMSMGAGEYVSVSSQLDVEKADLDRERQELLNNIEYEHDELANIYVTRGLEPALAKEVAKQLMAHDALGAHARDELGINEMLMARPIQAALASVVSYIIGAIFPLIIVILSPLNILIPTISVASILFLAILGGWAAYIGGSSVVTGILRVTIWGALALVVTAMVGKLFGAII